MVLDLHSFCLGVNRRKDVQETLVRMREITGIYKPGEVEFVLRAAAGVTEGYKSCYMICSFFSAFRGSLV